MKYLNLFLLMSLFVNSISAAKKQGKTDNGSKWSVGISAGVGIPTGSFDKQETFKLVDTKKINGWAKPGFRFSFDITYKIAKKLGVIVQVGGNINNFDTNAYNKKIFPQNTCFMSKATPHHISQYLGGIFYNLFESNNKLFFNIHALAGLMTVKYSEFTLECYGGTTGLYAPCGKYKIETVSVFAYNVGIGLNYNLSDKLAIIVNADYLGGNPIFTSISTCGYTYKQNLAMNIGLINLSGGIALKF
jgi:opacity protein-like surface antigen